MLLNAYTIYDTKALTYSPPFYCVAHGQAVRTVMDAANDSSSNLGRHPGDYTVYCIGQFDDSSGQLMPAREREHITDVLPLVRVQPSLFTHEPQEDMRQPVNGQAK